MRCSGGDSTWLFQWGQMERSRGAGVAQVRTSESINKYVQVFKQISSNYTLPDLRMSFWPLQGSCWNNRRCNSSHLAPDSVRHAITPRTTWHARSPTRCHLQGKQTLMPWGWSASPDLSCSLLCWADRVQPLSKLAAPSAPYLGLADLRTTVENLPIIPS